MAIQVFFLQDRALILVLSIKTKAVTGINLQILLYPRMINLLLVHGMAGMEKAPLPVVHIPHRHIPFHLPQMVVRARCQVSAVLPVGLIKHCLRIHLQNWAILLTAGKQMWQ